MYISSMPVLQKEAFPFSSMTYFLVQMDRVLASDDVGDGRTRLLGSRLLALALWVVFRHLEWSGTGVSGETYILEGAAKCLILTSI